LQRQLALSRYETAWLILYKLRRAVVAPERTLLHGSVEVDEFAILHGGQQGRGYRRQDSAVSLVAVAIEIRGEGTGRLRLAALLDASAPSLCGFVAEVVEPGTVVHTDGWASYRPLAHLGYQHNPRSQRSAPPGEWLLSRAHRAISNFKAWMNGTHRTVSDEHLQVYLDEFVFGHNRRTPMAAFQTLLGLSAQRPPTTYRQIHPTRRLTTNGTNRIRTIDHYVQASATSAVVMCACG
jgi:ISXO2-like transposase domain